jgi:hypothetical protein
MSDWRTNKKTGLVYRPIYKNVYPLIAYESGYGNPSIFEVTKLGEVNHLDYHKMNNDKSLFNVWKKRHALSFDDVDDEHLMPFPYCEVDLSTVPKGKKRNVFTIWVKPTVRDYVKPETHEIFRDIMESATSPFKKSKTSDILYRVIPRGEYSHMYDTRYERTFELKDDPNNKGYMTRSVPSDKFQTEMLEDLKKGKWDVKYILPPYMIEVNDEDEGLDNFLWEVDFNSVPDHILSEVDKVYLKPTVKRFMRTGTKKHFEDIF